MNRSRACFQHLPRRELLAARWYHYAVLMRWDRPIGILLLLWPTLWALWIAARGVPDWRVFTIFTLGVMLMRSAGCVINDYADRDIDPHVQRTRHRPLAVGTVSPREALVLFGVLVGLALVLVLLTNTLTILLSFGGALLATLYPFMKRYTYMPQVFLGTAFAWSVPMAFAAQTGTVPTIAWLVFSATVLWTVAYDTMYAMVDREDDLRIGIKSTAILFADADRFVIGVLQMTVIITLIMIGRHLDLGLWYFLGVVAAAGLAVYQQKLIRERAPARCFKAFLNNNWFGAAIFAGLAVDFASRGG